MKTKYTLFLLLFSFVFSYAQEVENRFLQNKILSKEVCYLESQVKSFRTAPPIWEEDFGGGFPADWTVYTSNTAGGVSLCPWVWSNDGSWGYWNTNQGTSAAAAINSTTASNGFLISDADSANHYAYGQPSGTTYQYIDSYFTTSAIDLSSYSAVNLEFEHVFRYNNLGNTAFTPPTVSVSSDSISWTNYLVNGSITNNTQSLNPEILSLNISSVAANQSTVYIRIGWTARCYFWMIDDMKIVESPDNAISSSNEVIGGYWVDYLNYPALGPNTMIGLDYTHSPITQLTNHPYSFEAFIKNDGVATQHTVLKYDVSGPSTASGTSPVIVLDTQEDSIFVATPPFGDANTPIGSYKVDIWGEADSAGAGLVTTMTDIYSKDIDITDYIYAKDLGEDSIYGRYILGGMQDQNHITTRFEMYANENLYSARVYIHQSTEIGSEVKAIIYDVDTNATNDLIFINESDKYTITANDLGSWVDIPFLSPIPLYNGYAYEFGVVGFQGPDTSYIGVTNNQLYNGEHSLYDELGLSTQSNGTPTWYYITKAPMVRMNFEAPPNSVNENSSIFNIYPNPTNGIISIDLSQMLNCSIVVNNVLGQTVYTSTVTDLRNTIDLSSLEKGLYTVELRDNELLYSEKIILE